MMKFTKLFVLSLALLLLTSPAWAIDGLVGLGAGVAPEYEGSEDYQAMPMLMFKHSYDSGRYVVLKGTNLRVNLLTDKTVSLGPLVNYRFGRDDVDNDRVDAMDEIDGAFELGAFGGLKFDNLLLNLDFLADVSDKHDGATLTASVAYQWKASESLMVTPALSSTYASGDYMDTYFGVNSGNVGKSGFSHYKADSGMKDVGVSVTAHLTPWQNWGVMGIASVSALQGDAKDSPIVDDEGDSTQWFAGLMATYRWKQ